MKLKLTKKEINILLDILINLIEIKFFDCGIQSKEQWNQIVYKLFISLQKKQKVEFTRTELTILKEITESYSDLKQYGNWESGDLEKSVLFHKLQFMSGSFINEESLLSKLEVMILKNLICLKEDDGIETLEQSEIYEYLAGFKAETILFALTALEKRELLIYTEKGYKLNEKYFGENNET